MYFCCIGVVKFFLIDSQALVLFLHCKLVGNTVHYVQAGNTVSLLRSGYCYVMAMISVHQTDILSCAVSL